MKSYIIIPILMLAALFAACEDETAEQPTAAISVDSKLVEVNESVTMHFVGNAENVVVFPGDEGQNYDLISEGNSGLVVNKGIFAYAYTTPGLYKMVCVATNHANEGMSLFSDTCSVWIKVIDDITEINRLSAPQVLYDEVYADLIGSSDWLMALPRKMKYKTSTPTVSLSQKLKFYIRSLTTQTFVDGELFDSNKKYNLANVLTVTTRSNEGTERNYKLHTLNYGEFKTFEVAGVKATIVRTEYDYSYYEINLEVPAGTDIKKLKPEFTLFADNEKVYIGSTEQVSGESTIDFTNPVTYRFVTTSTENAQIAVESTCKVTVTVK